MCLYITNEIICMVNIESLMRHNVKNGLTLMALQLIDLTEIDK